MYIMKEFGSKYTLMKPNVSGYFFLQSVSVNRSVVSDSLQLHEL